MAAASKLSEAEVAAMLATLKASGVNVEDILAKKSETKTASTESVQFLPDAETDEISRQNPKRKGGAAEGSGSKRMKPAPTKTPVRKSGRTKKGQVPVVKEQSVPEAECEEFMKGRSKITEVIIDRVFMAGHQLVEVNDLFTTQRWDHLFREEVLVDEGRVRELYSQFKLEETSGVLLASFVINGEKPALTHRELANLLEVPASGYDAYIKSILPEDVAKGDVIKRVGEDPSNVSHQGKATTLGLINRILHRLVCTSVTPRSQKYEVVNFQDFLLLDQLRTKTPINFPKLILKHMARAASSKTHGLPYPGVVKKILVHLGIFVPVVESKLSSVRSEETIASFHWEFEEGSGWKNDQSVPAPPLPAAPQEVDPLEQHSLHPDEGSPAVIEALQRLSGKVDVFTERAAQLELLIEKKAKKDDVGWVSELRSKLEALESLSAVVKEIEESAKINMIHGTRIKEEIGELNRQLRYVGTELVEQLKLLVKD